jgi:hypothetical protein
MSKVARMHAAPRRCMQLLHGRVNNPETGRASMTAFPVALSLVTARRHRVTWDACFTRHRARQCMRGISTRSGGIERLIPGRLSLRP